MSHSARSMFVSSMTGTRFATSLVLSLAFGAACGGNEAGNGVDSATNAGTAGSSGLVQGTGGSVPGAGGSVPGTGGSVPGTGGSVPGTGGSVPGAGGSVPGTGGSVPGTGGSTQAGAANSTGATAGTTSCIGNFPSPNLDGAEHSVTVDGSSSWGELPHFWNTYGTGHLGLFLREDRGWGETLKAHLVDAVHNLGLTSVRQHGLFHEDIGIYREENGTAVYDFTRSDEVFDFFVEQGVAPIVELGGMPRDLARDPAAVVFNWESGISPPRDFELWQELVRRFVEHNVERYGAETVAKWYFEVWNEPECCRGKFWSGTLDEYLQLYDHSAAAVRAVLPNGRVGGPVASQPIELTQNTAIGETFLQHVTTDNYVTPGTPAGLDLFIYHSWDFIVGSVNGYFQGLDLLDSFGLDVGVAITEFGPTWEFGLYNEPQETAQGAAFVAQTYADIAQRCAREGRKFPITYSWWVLSDIFEEGTYREDDPFIGCMGLITRENIRKPAYNAYRFLAQLGNEQLHLSVNGAGDVGGMAARDANGGVQILVYNGQDPGEGPVDDVYYAVIGPQEMALTVSGLDPAVPYDVTAYRVDDTHGNAYGTWERQGRPSMSGMSDADWAELRDTMDSPAEPLGQGLCGDTFTQLFSLSSPGVLLVTLTPSSS
jgi:xylan 1,4-beta-xylosidase